MPRPALPPSPTRRASSSPNATLPAVLVDGFAASPTPTVLRRPTSSSPTARSSASTAPARSAGVRRRIDLDGGIVLPAFVDCTPISTRAISGRASPIPTAPSWARSKRSAPTARRDWTARRRRAAHGFLPALRLCPRHALLRTHLDSRRRRSTRSPGRSSPRCATRWRGRIELQARRLFGIDGVRDRRLRRRLVDAVVDATAACSAPSPTWSRTSTSARPHVPRSPSSTASTSISMSTRPTTRPRDSLRQIAEAALRTGFPGQHHRRPLLLAGAAAGRRGARHDGPGRRGRHRRRLAADVQPLPAGPRTPAARRAGAA